MKGYGLRAQEPSRETQISRESFKRNLHARRYWSFREESPPILLPNRPVTAQHSVRHVFIGSCKQATSLVTPCVFPDSTLSGASDQVCCRVRRGSKWVYIYYIFKGFSQYTSHTRVCLCVYIFVINIITVHSCHKIVVCSKVYSKSNAPDIMSGPLCYVRMTRSSLGIKYWPPSPGDCMSVLHWKYNINIILQIYLILLLCYLIQIYYTALKAKSLQN